MPSTISETELEFAYTFPGSLGVVLSVENNRDLISGKFDDAVDVLSDFLRINDTHNALDASRSMGLALVSQLCAWVEINARWRNNVDYVWKRSDGVLRGEYVSQDKFHEINEIFANAEDTVNDNLIVEGILVGLDLEKSFHFSVPDGDSYRGGLAEEFQKVPTTVGKRYRANIASKEVRKIATGTIATSYKLVSLIELESA